MQQNAGGLLLSAGEVKGKVCRRVHAGYVPVYRAAAWGVTCEDWETLQHARARAQSTMEKLAERARATGRSFLLVSHLNVLDYLCSALEPGLKAPLDHGCTALTVFLPERRVDCLASAAHLHHQGEN